MAVLSEKQNTTSLLKMLSGKFELTEQVQLEFRQWKKMRVDVIAEPKFEWPGVRAFGIELKKEWEPSNDGFKKVVDAFKQALDYKNARVIDGRLPHLEGYLLPYVFVCPSPADEKVHFENNNFNSMCKGLTRAFGRCEVGTVELNRFGGVRLCLSGSPLWTTQKGLRADILKHGKSRKIGRQ